MAPPNINDLQNRIRNLESQLNHEKNKSQQLEKDLSAHKEASVRYEVSDSAAPETPRALSSRASFSEALSYVVSGLVSKRFDGQRAVVLLHQWFNSLPPDERSAFKTNRLLVASEIDRMKGITDLCQQETLRMLSM